MKYGLLAALMMTALAGCLNVHVDPVEVKPITLNVNLKIDRELDDFFAFEKQNATTKPAPTTPAQVPVAAPTTQPL